MKIALVAEDAGHKDAFEQVLDALLRREVDWADESNVRSLREIVGQRADGPFLAWKDVADRAARYGVRVHGRGELGERLAVRKAVALLLRAQADLEAVVLLRDDDRRDRAPELRAARDRLRTQDPDGQDPDGPPVVVGVPVPEVESWLIVCFEPKDEGERARLAELERELGFDPRRAPGRLTSKGSHEARDAKRVLAVLASGDRDRAGDDLGARCLGDLGRPGQEAGLTPFVDELRTRLVPLFVRPGQR